MPVITRHTRGRVYTRVDFKDLSLKSLFSVSYHTLILTADNRVMIIIPDGVRVADLGLFPSG